MVARINQVTPLFRLNNRTYFYKETHNGSLMYYCKKDLAYGTIFQVRAKDMMPLLKDENMVILK